MVWTYHSLNQPDNYLFKSIGTALDQYQQTYEQFLLLADFNAEDRIFGAICGEKYYERENVI